MSLHIIQVFFGSAANEIFASTNTDMIGSIGTMVQWADFSEAYKAKGIKVHTAYASQSTDKNRMIADAQATGNYTELITTMLDPINNQFTSAIQQNRSGKIDLQKENVLTGKTYMAKDAVKFGLADKIGSLDMAIKRTKALASAKSKIMEQTNTAFANTLAAAKAESFELVDNVGFALTEENMNNVEAQLVALQTLNNTLNGAVTEQQAATDAATEQLAAANTSLTAANEKIVELEAKIVTLGAKAAAIIPNPALDHDASLNQDKTFLTSTDKLVAERKAKYGS